MRRGVISTQSFDPDDGHKMTKVPKSDEVKAQIEAALNKHFLFKAMDKKSVQAIISSMTRRLMAPNEEIIKQGDKGDTFYVIERGQVDVLVDGNKVGMIKAPAAFGELALMYNSPRAATIKCSDYGVLWVTDRMTFRRALAVSSAGSIQSRIEFLKKVPLLKGLSDYQIGQLADALQQVTYDNGEDIIVQGEDGSKFYIIEDGQVAVNQTGSKGLLEVARLNAGNFFGERALLKNEPRDASCTAADGPVTCLVLDREHFDQLLGPLAKLLEEINASREEDMSKKSQAGGGSESKTEKKPQRKMRKLETIITSTEVEADLRILRTIGTGTFGRVKLVEHHKTKKVMAMKCLQKLHVFQSHQVTNVMAEKNCMAEMDHPFCLKLFGTWQDNDQLYMFLELVQGGELWSLLYQSEVLPRTRFSGLKENNARMYGANVLAGFEHIHSLGYAYRDLKPENLLIDVDGYIKIVDFGFAKRIAAGKKTQTLCGTPEYLSPELVLSRGHNRAVDYWALGILIYELICGGTPFADPDQSKIFMKIVHSQRCLQIPHGFPRDCKDLILKLLNANPTLRLGMLRGGIEDIKNHRWFGGIDWTKLVARRYQTPYQPKVTNALDDRNFDEYDECDSATKFKGDQDQFSSF
jgi:serine/threonine protein kinase